MSNIAIEFDNVGKMYRLGRVGTGTLSHDLNRWWTMNILRKEDPYLKIGETNDRSTKGHSDYVWALRDISFKVEQGDVVGIIGKNGAGKSTLLKLLSRITSPSTGSIRYKGRIASLLEVGTGFHPEMTGRENIYMNGSIMGMTKKEITRKLDEIVDFAGVERYLDTPVKRYSSGMTVRLGFAVAAFLEPEILVVDEVLTVGDAEFQKKAIGKMGEVSSIGGRTVLFVSHNMNAVKMLCRNAIVLKDGMFDFSGTAHACVDHYIDSNSKDLRGYALIDNSMRQGGFSNEITIEEARFLCDYNNLGTDEPLVIELTLKKHFGAAEECRYSVNIFDFSDTRILGYVTSKIRVPKDRDIFKVRISLSNHYLTARKYKLSLNVGYKEMDGDIHNFDVIKSGVLSFEIKYIAKKDKREYLSWNPEWGAVIHFEDSSNAELLESL